MTQEALLAACRLACRISTTALDDEITELITSAFFDLEISGVADNLGAPFTVETADQLVVTAIKTYVKLHLGDLVSDQSAWSNLKNSYDEQKMQLKMRNHSQSKYIPQEEES